MGELYVINALAIMIFMVILFIVAQIMKDNSIVDIGWGIGFVIIAIVSFLYRDGYEPRQLVMLLLVTIWGLRLAIHLWIRAIGRGEDFRYANFRKAWGKNARMIAFFRVFMMQGLFMILLAYPIMAVNADQTDNSLDVWAWAGMMIWIIGLLFQIIGDYQLKRFKKTRPNKEAVLKSGLWRYTRHPNYFGEATMWWGIFLIVLPIHLGWISVLSALFMNLLLVKVSGVPFLDKRYAGNADYAQYKRETNRFIPWFPKNASNE
ncbi:DUF1295 domain-containing protein [Cohnella herbarum]|uniref:DUF1295 domain-containing protein n=1 Tax=Cohnella herbarum TaxID=2728023 RepID=A0A7Z2VFE9_9BACL|nr:DUF1295 domain-containing protein [Cohnella herbarum]QJD82211.1 DUF1295 domain-containing protein [Cohnella herbarum]